jgi:hypothetical protein
MSTARYRLALACTCTSLLLAATVFAQSPGGVTSEAVELQLELELARVRDPYLLLDLGGRRLEVRARGMVLDAVPIAAVTVQAFVPLMGGLSRPRLEVPAVWRVTQAPEDTWRRVIAPASLRPYNDDEEEPTPTPAGTSPGPAPTLAPSPTPVEVPADYGLSLDSGWRLEMSTEEPGGFGSRLAGAIANGWARLWGMSLPKRPPRLVLTLAAEDARRVRHLFLPGMAILLASAAPAPAAS